MTILASRSSLTKWKLKNLFKKIIVQKLKISTLCPVRVYPVTGHIHFIFS